VPGDQCDSVELEEADTGKGMKGLQRQGKKNKRLKKGLPSGRAGEHPSSPRQGGDLPLHSAGNGPHCCPKKQVSHLVLSLKDPPALSGGSLRNCL
jgi:hypothetical protein